MGARQKAPAKVLNLPENADRLYLVGTQRAVKFQRESVVFTESTYRHEI